MSKRFNKLRIVNKINETDRAQSIIFDAVEGYEFKPGQYLTVKIDLQGTEHRRAYSIFTVPGSVQLGFTVKRLEGGLVSNHLIDNFKVGDEIEVMTPDGKFVVDPQVQAVRDHYFIAAGSGITPVMSMIATLLEQEPLSSIYLLYSNRDENSIIFKKALDKLATAYGGQFHLKYILSQPIQEKAGGLSGLFGKKAQPSWRGLRGRITGKVLSDFLDEFPSKSGYSSYYLCGPLGMISTVENALLGRDVSKSEIKKELFTADITPKDSNAAVANGAGTQAEVKLNGETFTLTIPTDKTVLDAIIDMGKDPPYSCTSGACSTCVAKVTEGAVEMEACFALDDEEVEDGYVLTCQSKCTTSTLKLDFEA